MARKAMEFEGVADYLKELESLSANAEAVCKRALYQGAAVMASAIKSEMAKIPDRSWHSGRIASGLTEEEKADLASGFGISKMRNSDGVIDVKLGFDGYGKHKTRKYPSGVPVPLIARSICKGTSWLQKYDFVGKAERAAKAATESKIQQTFDQELEKLINK